MSFLISFLTNRFIRGVSVTGGCVVVALLSGCVSIPADRGLPQVQSLVMERAAITISTPVRRENCRGEALKELLHNSSSNVLNNSIDNLNADSAVSIALLCSPQLQQLYASLALTQADVYEATRLSNPQLSFSRLVSGAPDNIVDTTWSISQQFVELLLMPTRQRIGGDVLLASQRRIANEVLELERRVRTAYVMHISAAAVAEMQKQAATAAQLAARAAIEFHTAGNISELQLSRERAAALEATIELNKAEQLAAKTRSDLYTMLGIAPGNVVLSRAELPLPVRLRDDPAALLVWSREQRLDLQALRLQVSAFDRQAQQKNWSRWLGDGSIGFESEHQTGDAAKSGPTASLSIPLFNSHRDAVLRARAQFEASQASLTELEVALDNEVYAVLTAARTANATATSLREQLVPLRERMTQLAQQQFNYMFIGTFELLAIKREEIDTYRQYIEAVRDEWIAQIEVQRVAGGKLPPTLLLAHDVGGQP